MKTYYYGHSLYTRGKPLPVHVDWLRKYGFLVVSLSPAYPEELMTIRDVPITSPRTLIMNPADYNGVSGNLALQHVRTIRPNSLANEHFVTFLATYEPQPVL